MDYTTYFNFEVPPYKTLRFDTSLNLDVQTIEAALLGFPSEDPPGSSTNYPNVTPTNGMRWIDTGNHQEKVYYNSSWQVIKQFT